MPIRTPPKPTYEELEAEVHRLKVERANRLADVERVVAWMNDPKRKRAVHAFTDGPERQIAYWVEMRLQGEFICRRCGLRDSTQSPVTPEF